MPTAEALLGVVAVRRLVVCLAEAAPGLSLVALRECEANIGPLAFRERVDAVRNALLADLPGEYGSFAAVVRTALRDPAFAGWLIAPVAEAVAVRALAASSDEAFDDGFALLAELTARLTAEFAIRPLLSADLDRALAIVRTWTTSPDEHVRRLASEGTRAHLPWGKRVDGLLARPAITLPILDALYRDESEYVRRSVANHLNDLSRANPDLVVATTTRWLAAPDEKTPRLVQHALRTLIKRGDPQALALLGFAPLVGLVVEGPRLDAATATVGGELRFEFTLENRSETAVRVAVDYIIHHQKANGTLTPKVFKLTTRTLAPGERSTITRRHSFKLITTRVYYPGEHAIELQVNGAAFGRTVFTLNA